VLSVFEKSNTEWASVDTRIWRARYEARSGDLRKALDWCFGDGGDASLGVDLAISAILLWNEQTSISEQRYQVARALRHCESMTEAPKRTAALAMSRAWSMVFARQLHVETDDAWNLAVSFAERTGDKGQYLLAIFGKALFLIVTGRFEHSASLLRDSLPIAQTGDRSLLIDAERLIASAEMRLGNLGEARAKLERLAEELARGAPSTGITRFQLQRYVGIHSDLANLTWMTGQPERALAMTEEIILKAGHMGQPLGQYHVLVLVAIPLAQWSGHFKSLDKYSMLLRGNIDHENLALVEPVYRFYTAVSQHARGDLSALEDMRQALNELVRDRHYAEAPRYFAVLADALVESGRFSEADEVLEAGLTLLRQTKENWFLPELLRVRANIMAGLGKRDHALAMLGRARENAIAIGARSFELRIVNDLAQTAMARGNNEEAIKFISPIYESFEDKNATEDLKRSARLLNTAKANRTGNRSIER
jgi:tetratricopeptide (TPR) repeat protein